MSNQFTIEMSKQSNAELLRIINEDRSRYDAEAVTAAEEELLIRKLSDSELAAARQELHHKLHFEGLEPVVVHPLYFALLSISTFGIYELWWMYRSWKYFKQRENLDIMPASRAIFAYFFMGSLFNKIAYYCSTKQREVTYNSPLLVFAFIVFNVLSKLPDPYWIISVLSFVPLIGPVKELNYYFTGDVKGGEHAKLDTAQKVILGIGAVFWLLIIIGLSSGEDFSN